MKTSAAEHYAAIPAMFPRVENKGSGRALLLFPQKMGSAARGIDCYEVARMTVDCRANKRQLPSLKRKTFVKRLSSVFAPCN
jgi:hypothetical protein